MIQLENKDLFKKNRMVDRQSYVIISPIQKHYSCRYRSRSPEYILESREYVGKILKPAFRVFGLVHKAKSDS